MHKIKLACILAIALLSTQMISTQIIRFDVTPTASAQAPNRIVLPFRTSWENDPSNAIGHTNMVDWKTNDFYGYYGPGYSLQPECGWRNNEVTPPSTALGFGDFGSRQLMAAGWFNTSSTYSYCYMDLFDQTPDDYNVVLEPIKLQQYTFINIWYYHAANTCCMIDGELYNPVLNQWSTLRGFNYNGQYIKDQNGVRIHPAARRVDTPNSWQFATFDLSLIYKQDPNWYITKFWIGMDNDPSYGAVQTGPVRTYFDMLYVSYGVNGVANANVGGLIRTNAQVRGSVIAWSWADSAKTGYYDLNLKITDMGWVDNPLWFCPYKLRVNVTGNINNQYINNIDPTGENLTATPDPRVAMVGDWLMDCAFTAMSAAAGPYGLVIDAAVLAGKAVAIAFYQKPDSYTYEWQPAQFGMNMTNECQSTLGEVYVRVTVPAGSQGIAIPVDLYTEIWADAGNGIGQVSGGTISTRLTLYWTTPDVNTSPVSGSPSVTLSHPSFADTTLKHVGNPNGNDCNMHVSLNGQGPEAFVSPYGSLSIEYSGNIWARPGAPGNVMFAVIGMGNTPLDTTNAMGPGVYPGQSYDRTYTFNIPYSYGVYYLYGIAAAVNTADQAKQQYIDIPGMRFLVGVITVGSAGPVVFLHGTPYAGSFPFTVTASITPPPCYLLSPQTTINGNTYYAYAYLKDALGNTVGSRYYMNLVQNSAPTQSNDTGGVYTCSYPLSTVTPNAYYSVVVHVDSTNGKSNEASTTIYYYNNVPCVPSPLTGSMYGSAYTYRLSTTTGDPDGDYIYYQIDWGDSPTWPTYGPYFSGTTITVMHTWGAMTSYTVRVRGGDVVGAWSDWATSTINIHNPTLSISVSGSGSTNSSTQSYPYGTNVAVKATASSGYYFAYWYLDGSTSTSNPITVTMNGDHSLTAYFYSNGGGGGGCPILYTYDGKNYQCEGLLNIHNAAGIDVTTNHTLTYTPGQVGGVYNFEFIEHPETISHIDQVKLYAVLQDGRTVTLPLVWAWQSEYGNVLPQLLFADGWKTIEYGANWNNGVSQSIQMKFLALPSNVKVKAFIFQIKGCNVIIKN
jgi:hypothetical protein